MTAPIQQRSVPATIDRLTNSLERLYKHDTVLYAKATGHDRYYWSIRTPTGEVTHTYVADGNALAEYSASTILKQWLKDEKEMGTDA